MTDMTDETRNANENAVAVARHVTWVGFWCNALLGTVKVIAGIIGRSGAVVADGIHSFSDFITDVIVLVMVSIGRKGANKRYEYGHGKYETFGTMLVAWALVIVGAIILYEGVIALVRACEGTLPPRPAAIALAVCVLSIVVKEWLYRYTVKAGRRIDSQAVIANAWHHRSDSFSSIATLVGVSGAMFMGEQWRILDPIAQIIVSVFIITVGIRTSKPAILELLEVSLPHDVQQRIADIISSTDGVESFHHLRTRRNGKADIIDVHIKVNPYIPVIEGHAIATAVEKAIREQIGPDTMVTTHIEPYFDKS